MSNVSKFLNELSRRNNLDVLIIDLDPSASSMNKWIVSYGVDMVLPPVQPNMSSAFAVHAALTEIWPQWVREAEDMGVESKYNWADGEPCRGIGAVGERGRSGPFRVLPHPVTNYKLSKRGIISVVDYNIMALIDMVVRNSHEVCQTKACSGMISFHLNDVNHRVIHHH